MWGHIEFLERGKSWKRGADLEKGGSNYVPTTNLTNYVLKVNARFCDPIRLTL